MFRHSRILSTFLVLASLVLLFQAAPVLAAGINVSPSSGGFGTTFTLTGDGFNSGEKVSLSVIAPNGSSVSSGTLTADSHGRIQFSAKIPSGSPTGTYSVNAQGQSSHHQYSASFTVTGASGSTGTTTSPGLAPAGMAVTPSSGGYSTVFTISAGGLQPWERVSVWLITPNGGKIGPQDLFADGRGAIQVSGKVPSSFPSGTYTAYAQGQSSFRTVSATFTVTVPTPTSFPDWKGEYFSNIDLSGSPTMVRDDSAIDFNWGAGSPPSIPNDNFSVRWTRSVFLSAGTYTFTATTDDGMRVWVGGTLLIDQWHDQSATTYTRNITLAAGTYGLRVEYYEHHGDAVAEVSWSATGTTTLQPWTGTYYDNPTLCCTPVFTRQDPEIDFNWAGGSPGGGIPGTNWSAKWDSTQFAPSGGNYTIFVYADDGVRVWVDGDLVIDQWHDQPPTLYSSTGYLAAGAHQFHVEYYQHLGGSTLQIAFAGPS